MHGEEHGDKMDISELVEEILVVFVLMHVILHDDIENNKI